MPNASQLHVEEIFPAPDPWRVARRLTSLPNMLFFDSGDRRSPLSRFSYVMAAPQSILRGHANESKGIWERLTRLFPARKESRPDLPPFQGGVAGLFGYGLGRTIESLPAAEFDEFALPDLAVGVYRWVISFDHLQNRAWLIARDGEGQLGAVRTALAQPNPPVQKFPAKPVEILTSAFPLNIGSGVTSNFSRDNYEFAVRRAIEAIHAGDCFQVSLSQRLIAPLCESSLSLYSRLRRCNPAPFGAYFDAGEFQILSASPERFLALDSDGRISTRPIKGTRRRGNVTPEEDFALQDDLLSSEKDRAENVMIVDLMRNDLGRVCEYGSIRVPQLCKLESYATVHHLVSEVHGQLRNGLNAIDLLRAAFPGGSVTGAPKVRAMEIIAELERVARGAYCGCMGWIGFDGAMDTSILIRTMTASSGWLQFPVGGGIVADSDPALEYEETLHKAEGMLRALSEPEAAAKG